MLHPVQSHLEEFAKQFDRRSTLFDVSVMIEGSDATVHGHVLERVQHDAVLALVQEHITGEVRNRLIVAPESGDYAWAVVRWVIVDVRGAPSRLAELVTEATYGEAVEILRRRDEWVQVRLSDGYLGWVVERSIHATPDASRYRAEATHVTATRLRPFVGLEGEQLGLMPWGTLLPVLEFREGMAFFMSPDGIPCSIEADALIYVEDRPSLGEAGIAEMLGQLRQFIGVPYLWGGTTVFGFDCSGMAQAAYRWLGHELPRDADMQAQTGTEIDPAEIKSGDLLFWASRTNNEQRRQSITHVSIAIDEETMIHANQRNWGVSIDSIEALQAIYAEKGNPGLVAVRRMVEL